MVKIYYIPIEPLEERYSAQWYKLFPKKFKENGYEVIIIDGIPLTNRIITGTFLDINSTAHYKSTQLQQVSKLFYKSQIKNGDIFFIADIEFWGFEMIRYLSKLQNIDVKIYGFLHAGSYTSEDFMSPMEDVGRWFEMGWIASCDKVFVGSNYHKEKFLKERINKHTYNAYSIDEKKIIVTGNPIDIDKMEKMVGKYRKKNQVVLPNRFDWEKRPNISLDICKLLKKRNPSLKIIITTSSEKLRSNRKWLVDYAKLLEKEGVLEIKEGLSKKDYYKILAESKVMLSTTIEENFGYCVAESLVFNTYPVCENNYSHPELVENDKRLLFNDIDEIIPKIEWLLKQNFKVDNYAKKYDKAIDNMINEMKNG